jgi:hypothetical protein
VLADGPVKTFAPSIISGDDAPIVFRQETAAVQSGPEYGLWIWVCRVSSPVFCRSCMVADAARLQKTKSPSEDAFKYSVFSSVRAFVLLPHETKDRRYWD